jgi:hypothetical protein
MFTSCVRRLDVHGIESAKLCDVEPKAYLLCATRSRTRGALNEISTLYGDRNPDFLETLRLVQEITQEMEAPPVQTAA